MSHWHAHQARRHGARRKAALWLIIATFAAVVAVRALVPDDVAGAVVPENVTADGPTSSPAAASGSAVAGHRHGTTGTRGATRSVGDTPDVSAQTWHRVLDRLSRLRAGAWRHSRPTRLRSVYAPGAPELTSDQAMLRHYADRHLQVLGARLVFARVRLVRRGPHFVVLRVIDQLAPAVALDRHGARLRLPRDEPSRHTIELRRTSAGWRIASVQTR